MAKDLFEVARGIGSIKKVFVVEAEGGKSVAAEIQVHCSNIKQVATPQAKKVDEIAITPVDEQEYGIVEGN